MLIFTFLSRKIVKQKFYYTEMFFSKFCTTVLIEQTSCLLWIITVLVSYKKKRKKEICSFHVSVFLGHVFLYFLFFKVNIASVEITETDVSVILLHATLKFSDQIFRCKKGTFLKILTIGDCNMGERYIKHTSNVLITQLRHLTKCANVVKKYNSFI